MSYKVEVHAADVDWQIQALIIFPEIVNKHFYPAMHRSANALVGAIEPNIPEKSGLLKSRFRKAVSGKGLFITARVGFANFVGVSYVIPLEYGAQPHEIGYVPSLDVSIRMHPGISARGFMAHGLEQAQSEIDNEMDIALRGVVNELGKD